MRHCIGKGTLQHGFRRDALKLRSQFKMPRHVCERFVKMGHSRSEIGQLRRTVCAAYKESSSVPQNVVHVANQLMRRTNQKRGAKLGEFRRRGTKRFLRPIDRKST